MLTFQLANITYIKNLSKIYLKHWQKISHIYSRITLKTTEYTSGELSQYT